MVDPSSAARELIKTNWRNFFQMLSIWEVK